MVSQRRRTEIISNKEDTMELLPQVHKYTANDATLNWMEWMEIRYSSFGRRHHNLKGEKFIFLIVHGLPSMKLIIIYNKLKFKVLKYFHVELIGLSKLNFTKIFRIFVLINT